MGPTTGLAGTTGGELARQVPLQLRIVPESKGATAVLDACLATM